MCPHKGRVLLGGVPELLTGQQDKSTPTAGRDSSQSDTSTQPQTVRHRGLRVRVLVLSRSHSEHVGTSKGPQPRRTAHLSLPPPAHARELGRSHTRTCGGSLRMWLGAAEGSSTPPHGKGT